MGEIADMMLDGTLCECCGEVFEDILDFDGDEEDDDAAPGHPRRCAACSEGDDDEQD